jgi:hypothetical protein
LLITDKSKNYSIISIISAADKPLPFNLTTYVPVDKPDTQEETVPRYNNFLPGALP